MYPKSWSFLVAKRCERTHHHHHHHHPVVVVVVVYLLLLLLFLLFFFASSSSTKQKKALLFEVCISVRASRINEERKRTVRPVLNTSLLGVLYSLGYHI